MHFLFIVLYKANIHLRYQHDCVIKFLLGNNFIFEVFVSNVKSYLLHKRLKQSLI